MRQINKVYDTNQ